MAKRPTRSDAATEGPAAPKQRSANKRATAKKPANKEPANKKPTAKKPTAKKPTAKKPTAKKPTNKRPTAKKPANKKPASKRPTAKKPATKKPANKRPANKKPGPKKRPGEAHARPRPRRPKPHRPRRGPSIASVGESAFFALASTTRFSAGASIDAWFKARTGRGYIDWFNATCARKGFWSGRALGSTAAVKARFLGIWDNIPVLFGAESCSLVQFLCLMSIFTNEVGAELLPISEAFGRTGHPGIAYLFDAIPGLKRSYNKAPNRTAFDLFQDADFLAAHAHRPLAATLANTTDARWKGTAYPSGVTTSGNPNVAGIILETDFFKFRGRGFIQTTFRANYAKIIDWIKAYDGVNLTVLSFTGAWKGLATEVIATRSSNADWDVLFQNSDAVIPSIAVRLHARGSGDYLTLSTDLATAKGTGAGSIYRVGLRVSGGADYATKYQGRVLQMLTQLQQTSSIAQIARA